MTLKYRNYQRRPSRTQKTPKVSKSETDRNFANKTNHNDYNILDSLVSVIIIPQNPLNIKPLILVTLIECTHNQWQSYIRIFEINHRFHPSAPNLIIKLRLLFDVPHIRETAYANKLIKMNRQQICQPHLLGHRHTNCQHSHSRCTWQKKLPPLWDRNKGAEETEKNDEVITSQRAGLSVKIAARSSRQ